jgi:hypothetical protein
MDRLKVRHGYDERGYRSVYLCFGKIEAVLSENVDYLGDQLKDGCCYLAVPFKAQSVFNKHRVNSVTQIGNPFIFSLLRQSFANPDVDFFIVILTQRAFNRWILMLMLVAIKIFKICLKIESSRR